ncbi:helix-turn-helix domain-containing protein [Halalkalibacter krulwichiae]|uniref:Helix-turn-helix domain protein n=1 Tax=Halalkalibacter krulwichiae TaxID=199441 RepID=A0A1X9ME43_9BACI|nr:helix-turn-helix transcriptional regulator [Halalkalibacter krulwichiae]ARK30800.1 Helix-turn-helix domain protein [Halalkalibacter krulwichiae]
MLGIEYIPRTFKMKYKELAEELGVSPASMNYWVKGKKKIPKERLEQLSQIFNLPSSYFQKELNRVEIIDVELAYYDKLSKEEMQTITETGFDYEEEEHFYYEVTIDPYETERKYLRYKRVKEELLLQTENMLFKPVEVNNDDNENLNELMSVIRNASYMEILEHFNRVFEKGELEHIEVLQVMMEALCIFGNKPSIANNSKLKKLADDMRELLMEHGVTIPIKSKK